ncbi:hypothetical protein CQ12_07645 [Bradyrhizobium jicamae]|uniref:Uncharacterized protein n=1 Tax=Bradyrhizobium jicamae TaxID=280332 RepID=A0A0R3M4B2_9BRAD|nr:hypothetical protein CQ12_07645 [Bradyrhizobium jicamae]
MGLADDAAIGAKRMQNGAAVEANLSRSRRQQVADGHAMVAIMLGNPTPEARAESMPLPPIAASVRHGFAASALPSDVECAAGLVHATDTPQMLHDVGGGLVRQSMQDIPRSDYTLPYPFAGFR